MIQRIQTVWLLLASACAFLTIRLSFYSGSIINNTKVVLYKELTALSAGVLTTILTITIGLLALINIFLFKKRILQLRLCVAGILLEALLIYLYYREVTMFTNGNYSLSSILHSCIIIFFVLAGRGINKDEKLVKDSDRLR